MWLTHPEHLTEYALNYIYFPYLPECPSKNPASLLAFARQATLPSACDRPLLPVNSIHESPPSSRTSINATSTMLLV